MYFSSNEKIFSLSSTAANPPPTNITSLWEEFYCLLLCAGLFKEGADLDVGVMANDLHDLSAKFYMGSGWYPYQLGEQIKTGLMIRYNEIMAHPQTTPAEKDLLTTLGLVLNGDPSSFASLSAKLIYARAISRSFSEPMQVVARYLSVAYGQQAYLPPAEVPVLYLSVFGNIHLSQLEKIELGAPLIHYGEPVDQGPRATALWAILSSEIDSFTQMTYPGDSLSTRLSSLMFLRGANYGDGRRCVPMPYMASVLYTQRIFGIDAYNPINLSASFYKDFLFGELGSVEPTHRYLYSKLLDIMVEKTGKPSVCDLFSLRSVYRNLMYPQTTKNRAASRPIFLSFALENFTLAEEAEAVDTPPSPPEDGVDTDPPGYDSIDDMTSPEDENSADGGYDPSSPTASSFMDEEIPDKNIIGLISFDRSNEGIDEDLYRSTVVSLNDRLRNDDTLPISAEVRESLNHWVNVFLYRTNIQATKDQIKILRLAKYLNSVSTKG